MERLNGGEIGYKKKFLVGREVKESARKEKILVGREVKKKKCVKWDPCWPRGKINRPGEMLVGREIKESAIEKKKPFFSLLGRQPYPRFNYLLVTHFIFTAALLKMLIISSLWIVCMPFIFGYGRI